MSDLIDEAVFIVEEALIDALGNPDSSMEVYREGIDTSMLLRDEQKYGGRVLDWVREYIDEFRVAPPLSVVKEEFPEITFEQEQVPVEFVVRKIKSRYAFNQAQAVIDNTARAIGDDPIGGVKFGIRELTKLNKEVASVSPVIYVSEWQQGLADYQERMKQGKLKGFSFGYPEIDERLGGIKGLTFVLGRPKRFKSWQLLHSAIENMKMGVRPVFFSLEMTKEEMYDRFCAMAADMSYFRRVNVGWSEVENKVFSERMEAMEAILHMPIYHPPVSERNVPALMEIARAENADIVYIDQYSFLQSHRASKDTNVNDAHGMLCEDLKLAANANCPIYIAAQFNREAAKLGEMGNASQIGLTDHIPQKADLLMGCHQTKDMQQSFPQVIEFGTVEGRSTGWGSWLLSIDMGTNCRIQMVEEKKNAG